MSGKRLDKPTRKRWTTSKVIARNDDSPSGHFHVKKRIVVEPKDQVRTYKNKGGKLTLQLPDNPLRYTRMPLSTTRSEIL